MEEVREKEGGEGGGRGKLEKKREQMRNQKKNIFIFAKNLILIQFSKISFLREC